MEMRPLDQKNDAHRRRLLIAGATGLAETSGMSSTTQLMVMSTDINGVAFSHDTTGMPATLMQESGDTHPVK